MGLHLYINERLHLQMWGYIYKCDNINKCGATFINVRQHLQMLGYIYKCETVDNFETGGTPYIYIIYIAIIQLVWFAVCHLFGAVFITCPLLQEL